MLATDIKELVPAAEIATTTVPFEVTRGVAPKAVPVARPDLAGMRLMPLAGGPIYLVNPEGMLQWIPNPATYNNLFRDWNGVFRVDIANMAIGSALSDGAVLAKGHASSAVYVISNGKKRWVTSPAAMDKYHFNWNHVYVVPQVLINGIPTGASWS